MNKAFEICLQNYNLKEIRGSKHEEKIIEAFKLAGFGWIKDDETAWCAAWMVYCFHHAGLKPIKTVRARDWEKYGIETKAPKIGDVAVLWRISKASNYGHVGFYVRENETHVLILGGNQNNEVCMQWYRKDRVLSYRSVSLPSVEDVQDGYIDAQAEKIKDLNKQILDVNNSKKEIRTSLEDAISKLEEVNADLSGLKSILNDTHDLTI